MKSFAPESCHEHLLKTTTPSLTFDLRMDFQTWRQEVGAVFAELVGTPPDRVPLDVRKEYEKDNDLFRETRFIFSSETDADVPCTCTWRASSC